MDDKRRREHIEDFVMGQKYLTGRSFRVHLQSDEKVKIMFEKATVWEMNKLRMRLAECGMHHIQVEAKEELPPLEKKKSRRGFSR